MPLNCNVGRLIVVNVDDDKQIDFNVVVVVIISDLKAICQPSKCVKPLFYLSIKIITARSFIR